LRGYLLRLLPALANAMAMACLIAFFFVGGRLVPIDPSCFQSSTSVLILLLTTDWLVPFLSGMLYLLAESTGRAFHPLRECNRIASIGLTRDDAPPLQRNALFATSHKPMEITTSIALTRRRAQ
jgi:hypothetical protein